MYPRRELRFIIQGRKLSLKLLSHSLKVTLQDGDQIGFQVSCLPLQCSVQHPEGYAQGGAGIRA